MKTKRILKQIGQLLAYIVTIFLLGALSHILFKEMVKHHSHRGMRHHILEHQKQFIRREEQFIKDKFEGVLSDARYLADLFTDKEEEQKILRKSWISFLNHNKTYSGVYYVDFNGSDRIAVQKGIEGASEVKWDQVGAKKVSMYLKAIEGFEEQGAVVFEIQAEEGGKENQISRIAIAVPCYSKNKEIEGGIILEYTAEDILNQIQSGNQAIDGDIYLISEGKQNLVENIFSQQFDKEWEKIKKLQEGVLSTEKGLFVFKRVLTSDSNYLIMHSKFERPHKKLINIEEKEKYFWGWLLASIVLGGVLSGKRNRQERIKYFAQHDMMTQVYNRRTGLDLMNKFKYSQKGGSICFVDINGLKVVNDELGHKMGDELIITISQGIKANIRVEDVVVRMGGDEFLIVFNGATLEEAEKVWQRMVQYFESINREGERPYIISVSHGIEYFSKGDSRGIEEVIQLADERMYQEKREVKKGCSVIRV